MKLTRKKKLIAAAAVVLALIASTGLTVAYFSDYEAAMGEVILHMSGETQITEEVTDTSKEIAIVNTGKEGDANVVVRVSIYGPDGMDVDYDKNDWEKRGDYYYYKGILKPTQQTSKITASVADIPVTADLSQFDIIVTHESAIAAYNENNKVKTPDGWDYIPDISAQ